MKKFILGCLLASASLVPNQINAQQEVVVGTGTSSWYYTPITRLFENGASETLYDGADIGVAGTINAVGWNIVLNPYATTTGNVKIYMKETTNSTVASTASLAGYTLVYSGNVDNDVLGWQNIPLTTSFSYTDPAKNLSVLVVHASGNYTLSVPQYSYTAVAGKTGYYYSISSPWTESSAMIATPNRANIKLYFSNLSTVEIADKSAIRYYPNPVKDVLNITASNDISATEIYSLEGKLLKSSRQKGKEVKVDFSDVKIGTYLVKVGMKNGEEKSLKIIKE